MLTTPRFRIRFDDLTRMMEITRTDVSSWAEALGMDKPATRLIRLPEGFTYSVFYRDFQRWLDGELIQHALPYLPREDRGFLTSGVVLEDLPEEEEEEE
jgi:hypothetical protein